MSVPFMTPADRCREEIREIENRPDVLDGTCPAYLVVLGTEDWKMELKLIEKQDAT